MSRVGGGVSNQCVVRVASVEVLIRRVCSVHKSTYVKRTIRTAMHS